MKTRSIEVSEDIDSSFDPFKDLPPTKPLSIGEVSSILNQAQTVAPNKPTVEIVSSSKNAVDLSVSSDKQLSEEWIRQDLPSLCIPYSFREVFLRPLTIRALSKLHSARVNMSFPILVDALNMCINEDIRSLTPEDFVFVMHWIRDNSYPAIPLRIEHKTMYGNTIEVNIRRSNLKITEFNLTKEEYSEWYKRGYCVPTVRDAELINRNEESMDSETEWMLETAQYIRPFDDNEEINYDKYVDNKFARLDKMGPQVIVEIEKFKQLIKHGIEQTVEVVDSKFEPEAAIAYLDSEINKIRSSMNEIPEDIVEEAPLTIIMAVNKVKELEVERNAIQQAIDNGEIYTPKKEVVAVNLTATEFFPRL